VTRTTVRVAAEHARVGLRRGVADAVFLPAGLDHVGVLGVVTREGPDPVVAQELLLVHHDGEHPEETVLVQDCTQR
jgi:hypothetical protein